MRTAAFSQLKAKRKRRPVATEKYLIPHESAGLWLSWLAAAFAGWLAKLVALGWRGG